MRFLPCHHLRICVQLSLQPQKKSIGKLSTSFSYVGLGNKQYSTFSMEEMGDWGVVNAAWERC